MLRTKTVAAAMLCVSTSFIISCGSPDSGARNNQSAEKHDDNKVVNLYIWADYMGPDTIASFEKQTGIKVRVSYFDSDEALEGRVLTGHSGFDVVVPPANYMRREIRSGAYQPLDKAKLPNLVHLDPVVMSRVAVNDPENAHGVVYTWGTIGIGFNEKQVAEAFPNGPVKSWRLVFDPQYAGRLAKCGIGTVDSPAEVLRLVLLYLGRNPDTPNPQDLKDAEAVLLKVRPFIRMIASDLIESLANGDICVATTYNGGVIQARSRAKDAKNGIRIGFFVPEEGSLLWADMLAIPRDAQHVDNAHIFINYLMDPHVMAKISNSIGFANANMASIALLDPSVSSDPAIFPTPDEQKRLAVLTEDTPEQTRAITRIWQKFKTAQ